MKESYSKLVSDSDRSNLLSFVSRIPICHQQLLRRMFRTRPLFKLLCAANWKSSIVLNKLNSNGFIVEPFAVAVKMSSFASAGQVLSQVTTKLNDLFPLELAEGWDNVGLLLQPSTDNVVTKVLLTNDLTENVLQEAIDQQVQLIFSYHPPLFRSFKRFTIKDWKERIAIKCLENRIAIYSPHTAADAIQGGVNDWLVSCLPVKESFPVRQSVGGPQTGHTYTHRFRVHVVKEDEDASSSAQNTLQLLQKLHGCKIVQESDHIYSCFCSKGSSVNVQQNLNAIESALEHYDIAPLQPPDVLQHGIGRVVTLKWPISLSNLVDTYKDLLKLPHLRLALGRQHIADTMIRKVAVCAGSGGTVLDAVDADLLVTGEMSHHEVLDAVHRNQSVILAEHSNSERGYLTVLQAKLIELFNNEVQVLVSQTDHDPLTVV